MTHDHIDNDDRCGPLEQSDEPRMSPLSRPHPDAKPPQEHVLTPEQQQHLDKLIAHFNAPGFALPITLAHLKQLWKRNAPSRGWFGSLSSSASSSPSATPEEILLQPLSDIEKCYWSSEQFQRCARAVKWDYAASVKRAEEILVWRRDFGVDTMQPEQISIEGETGKELSFGFDFQSRPVLYMHPYRQNTKTSPRQIQFVVWCLERTLDLLPPTNPPTEMLCLCIDFGASRNIKTPPTSPSTAKKVLDILQTYYCERLGRAICADVPSYFWPFYRIVGPFIDPRTKDKVRFLEKPDATDLVPASQLQDMFGGDVHLAYDHDTFFPAWTKLCEERRAQNLERWRKFGEGRCGLSEAVIRGAIDPWKEKEGRVAEKFEAPTTKTLSTSSMIAEDAKDLPGGVDKLVLAPREDGAEKTPELDAAPLAAASPKPLTLGEPIEKVTSTTSSVGVEFVDAPVASEAAVRKAVEPVA